MSDVYGHPNIKQVHEQLAQYRKQQELIKETLEV